MIEVYNSNNRPSMRRGFIIPIEGDHLGLPIFWNDKTQEYYQLKRTGTQLDVASKTSEPTSGFVVKGRLDIPELEEIKNYSMDSVSVVSLNQTFRFKHKNVENNKDLDEYIRSLSRICTFDVDSPKLVDVLNKTVELEADIFISWCDHKSEFWFAIWQA